MRGRYATEGMPSLISCEVLTLIVSINSWSSGWTSSQLLRTSPPQKNTFTYLCSRKWIFQLPGESKKRQKRDGDEEEKSPTLKKERRTEEKDKERRRERAEELEMRQKDMEIKNKQSETTSLAMMEMMKMMAAQQAEQRTAAQRQFDNLKCSKTHRDMILSAMILNWKRT